MQPRNPYLLACAVLLGACEAAEKTSTELDVFEMPERFAHVDTAQAGFAIGCVGSFYKQLSDSTVLVLQLAERLPSERAKTLQVDSIGLLASAKLWLFAKDSAHMSNVCTDVIMANYPKPIAEAIAVSGTITLMEHPHVHYYGNDQPVTSILVHHLSFVDPRWKKPIVVNDELLWKVLDRGRAG